MSTAEEKEKEREYLAATNRDTRLITGLWQAHLPGHELHGLRVQGRTPGDARAALKALKGIQFLPEKLILRRLPEEKASPPVKRGPGRPRKQESAVVPGESQE